MGVQKGQRFVSQLKSIQSSDKQLVVDVNSKGKNASGVDMS